MWSKFVHQISLICILLDHQIIRTTKVVHKHPIDKCHHLFWPKTLQQASLIARNQMYLLSLIAFFSSKCSLFQLHLKCGFMGHLTNYRQNVCILDFLKLFGYWLSWQSADTLKKIIKKKRKKEKKNY
jgi:hypothetical protein